MIASILLGLAFLASLNTQSTSTPIVGYWVLFLFAGCAAALRNGYPKQKGILWWAAFAWVLAVCAITFVATPVPNGLVTAVKFLIPCFLVLCLGKDQTRACLFIFGTLLLVYALNLIGQWLLHVKYTNLQYAGTPGLAWPLLDPNNAAAVVSAGLLVSFSRAMRRWYWWAAVGVFAAALLITQSRAGVIGATLGCFVLLLAEKMWWRAGTFLTAMFLSGTALLMYHPEKLEGAFISFSARIPMWVASEPLLWVRPWFGLGPGAFKPYYDQVRIEHDSGGYFAHNDLLQMGIEMGLPALAVFCFLLLAVAATTRKRNIVPALVVGVILLQSMVEFTFYVEAIAFIFGLALVCHRYAFMDPPARRCLR